VAEGLIPYWGFLAGLYEIIFFLFVLFLLNSEHKRPQRIIVVAIYCLTTLLRAAGGTRLVLIKELAFLVILFYLQGNIKKRQLVIAVSAILAIGTAIGLLRTQSSGDIDFLGPLYGLVMESGLNALTLNIAYKVQDAGFISQNTDILQTLMFVVLSAIPSFARFGITQPDLDAVSPYNAALNYGIDTAWPVGGMSGFATICYISSYPVVATIILAFTIGLLFRYAPAGNMKRITILVFSVNAIHFWRDPIDIAVKLVVQGVVCAVVLMCTAKFSTNAAKASAQQGEESAGALTR
jgi:hypothetical protein